MIRWIPVKAELGAEQSMRIGRLVGDELPPAQSRTWLWNLSSFFLCLSLTPAG